MFPFLLNHTNDPHKILLHNLWFMYAKFGQAATVVPVI